MDMILLDQLEIQGIHMSTEIVVEERIGLWLTFVQVNAKLQRWTATIMIPVHTCAIEDPNRARSLVNWTNRNSWLNCTEPTFWL